MRRLTSLTFEKRYIRYMRQQDCWSRDKIRAAYKRRLKSPEPIRQEERNSLRGNAYEWEALTAKFSTHALADALALCLNNLPVRHYPATTCADSLQLLAEQALKALRNGPDVAVEEIKV